MNKPSWEVIYLKESWGVLGSSGGGKNQTHHKAHDDAARPQYVIQKNPFIQGLSQAVSQFLPLAQSFGRNE